MTENTAKTEKRDARVRNLKDDMRACSQCGEVHAVDVYRNTRGDICYKSCIACRNRFKTLKEANKALQTASDHSVCDGCKKGPAERLMEKDSRGDIRLNMFKGRRLCDKCFIGDDTPLRLEDFIYSGEDRFGSGRGTW